MLPSLAWQPATWPSGMKRGLAHVACMPLTWMSVDVSAAQEVGHTGGRQPGTITQQCTQAAPIPLSGAAHRRDLWLAIMSGPVVNGTHRRGRMPWCPSAR